MLGPLPPTVFLPVRLPLFPLARATPTGPCRGGKLGAMTKPTLKPAPLMEIFRAGQHTDVNGRQVTLTEQDIAQIASAYDCAVGEAPLVVGHPKMNHPAYGWVRALKAEGPMLLAEPHQVDANFSAEVDAGRLKKRSASLFPPTHPNNPKPGQWYLRHVGFLGAAPPAVTGLRDYSFAADDTDVVEFAISEKWWAFGSISRLLRRMRDRLIETDGLEKADQVMPAYEIDGIEEAARPASEAASHSLFAVADESTQENDVTQATADLAAREESLSSRERDILAREQRLQEEADRTARADAVEFAAGLVTAGKILPASKDSVVELLLATAAIEKPLSFATGAGDGATPIEKPAGQVLREFLTAQPPVITFTERSGATHQDATAISFAAPPGSEASADKLELHAKAKAHQAANPNLTFLQAVKAVGG